MSLVTLPGKIAFLDSHALVVMSEGDRRQAVCIAADALPADGEKRRDTILECLAIFERIAAKKIADGDIAYDGKIWITSKDMIGCPTSARH